MYIYKTMISLWNLFCSFFNKKEKNLLEEKLLNKEEEIIEDDEEKEIIEDDEKFVLEQRKKIFLGKKKEFLYQIENEKDLEFIKIPDILSVKIHNCPKIKEIPLIQDLKLLENLQISHCTIKKCTTYFPELLKTLELSYSMMEEFSPQYIPITIAELDLSFNNLKSIPKYIEQLYDQNNFIKYNFNGNDLWFLMYSDLQPSLISHATINDLAFAYKLNLISTDKIRFCHKVLTEKKMHTDALELYNRVNLTLLYRSEEKKLTTTYNNPQNVHLNSVQENINKNIQYIFSYPISNEYENYDKQMFLNIFYRNINVNYFIKQKLITIFKNDTIHSHYCISFYDIINKVFRIIMELPEKKELLNILRDEIIDGIDTCTTGRITRVVNCLNGFLPEIKVSISKNEEISNSIIALRKKYILLYPNIEEYYCETLPVVMQLLEDMCMDESEQLVWLEYV